MDRETITRLETTIIDGAGRQRKMGDLRCGTHAGYARHYNRGEEPCALCRIAKAAYDMRNRDVPDNAQKARLSAKAQARANQDLHARHRDEYNELYRAHKAAIFEEAGFTYTPPRSPK